jgi:hypothetical protein
MKNIIIMKDFLKDNETKLSLVEIKLIKCQIDLLEKAYHSIQKCLLEVENSDAKQETLNNQIEELSGLAYV